MLAKLFGLWRSDPTPIATSCQSVSLSYNSKLHSKIVIKYDDRAYGL